MRYSTDPTARSGSSTPTTPPPASLDFIEDSVREQVLPRYGNAHGELRHRAANDPAARGRPPDHPRRGRRHRGRPGDLLSFRLVGILELRRSEKPPEAERPVVFVGPYEHHSNELPWRESVADVVVVDEAPDGHVDPARLEAGLRRYPGRPLRISRFSAASNVTGILTDADRVARLLHAYGALSFWDYAAAARTSRSG